MDLFDLVFRTSGAWGPGLTEDLTEVQVDTNFYKLVLAINAKAAQGVGISNFVANGGEFTVVLTDHTLLGPYLLPIAQLRFAPQGWQPETEMLANTIFSHAGSTYLVLRNHTTEATFDPGANDGGGNDFYGLLLENPQLALPPGGSIGAFLRKISATDYIAGWESAALTDLSDILFSTSPQEGDLLVYSGGVWTAGTIADLSILLWQLEDVDIPELPGPVTGQLLTFDGTVWTNQAPAFAPEITTPAEGQILTYKDGAWKNSNTADLPVKSGISVFGSLALDYADGAVQRVVMSNGVTLTGVSNWPPSGQFGRLVLEVRNLGAFTWEWPVGYHWPGGAQPVVSSNGRDLFALTTFDGGANVDGSVLGQNYL